MTYNRTDNNAQICTISYCAEAGVDFVELILCKAKKK